MSDEYVKIKKSDIGEIIHSMERDWDNHSGILKSNIAKLCKLAGFADIRTVKGDILESNRLIWEKERCLTKRSNQ